MPGLRLMLFVIIGFLFVFRLDLDIRTLALFRPRTHYLLINFLVDSVTCLEIISPVLISGHLFSAISDKTLPPVRKVCCPKAMAPLQMTGFTQRKKLPKNIRFRVRVEDNLA